MDKKNQPIKQDNFILYTGENGQVNAEVFIKDETIWMSQKFISELFGKERSVITKHLKNIFNSGELKEETVCAKLAHTAEDGKTYNTKYYNLDVIISVGYRVNSYKATRFRIWATKTLKEYMIKGFVMDDERLKKGGAAFGKDYFEELLELSSYPILQDKGKVSALQARLKAEKEYDQYRVIQDQRFESDFDREVKRITGKEDGE